MASEMRCPECGSDEVSCTSTRKEHVHECHACGYRMVAAPVVR
jgi:predicted RNA-binding Zn-ribbon protein involved in translation (DUF1610 family)